MTGLIIFFHVLISVLLVTVILMQSGRGGGLTESFASAESMFGAKTNVFMVRMTTVLTVLFIMTSLTLAFVSSQKDKSLIGENIGRESALPAGMAQNMETVPSDLDAASSPADAVMNMETTVPQAENSIQEQVPVAPEAVTEDQPNP